MTTRILTLALGLTLAGSALAQTRELGSSGELLDGVAALVDSGVVLKSEVRNRMQVVVDNFTAQQAQLPPEQRGQLPPVSVLEQQVLDQLVLEEILVQRADRIGIAIGDDLLNEILAEIAANVGVTLEALPSWLESQGVDYATFREDQRRDLAIRQLERREVVESIRINPRELEQCLELTSMSEVNEIDYNISHILIGFSPEARPDEIDAAEDQIRDIARQLDQGADFAQLAVAYSESQTALEGGQLGWRKGSELPTIFAADVMRMEVGEHSTPIRGGGGFHIVRLNDERGSEPQLVDQIRPRHILLAPNEVLDDEATRQKILGIRDQLVGGDDFATVASAVSEDTASAVDGGILGWTTLDQFVPEFSEVLESLEIGELSEPFRTRYGWHIAEVTDRRSYDMTDDRRELECRNQIGRGKAVEETELWRRRMQAQSYIDKKL
ncbi:MAG TPA: peptidylprolyl isomerase [Gammaproteobacteria bacterium]|nr:peptidylprolyl isomerase [Gammaproteobacteria bacterium]